MYDPTTAESQEDREEHKLAGIKKRLLWTSIFTIPLFYIAMGSMVGLPLPNFLAPSSAPLTYAMVLLLLTIPVIVLSWSFYDNGFRSLFKGHPNMDSLVSLATTAAFLYSLYGTCHVYLGHTHHAHHLYYESVAVILTLITAPPGISEYFSLPQKRKKITPF